MRYRAMGILFVLSGVFFVAGVPDPPILPTWGGSATDVMATAWAHRAAWFDSSWLFTLSIAAGLAAVELLVRTLDADLARVGRSLYLAGSTLGLASTTYDLSVTSTLLGAPTRTSLEIYSRLALADAQHTYDSVIDQFPV